jgi:hypothetical protein
VLDVELLAETEPLLYDWVQLSGSNVLAEEAEVVTPLSMTSALITSKQWKSSNMFILPTAQPNWLGHSPDIGWNAEVMDLFEQQIFPQAAKAFWPKGVKWRQLSLVRKHVLSFDSQPPRLYRMIHSESIQV